MLKSIQTFKNSGSTDEWKHLWSWFILLGIGLTWGSSYFFIKKALNAFTPIQISTLRLFITFVCFLPFAIPKLKTIRPDQWKFFAIVCIMGSALPSFLFPLAQTQLSSSFTGVLSSTTPIFTLSLGALFFGLKLSSHKILGVFIGFMGAAGLIAFSGKGALEGNPLYALLALMAAMFYAISSNTINKYLQDTPTLTISAVSFSLLGVPAFIYLSFSDILNVWVVYEDQVWESFLYIIMLALFGTVLSTLFFFKLIKMAGVVFSSTISYIIPCFALLIGLLDGEVLTWVHGLGMLLIVTGIYLTSRKT